MLSNITNHYRIGDKRPKLSCETRTLYTPVEGWSFAHHPCVAHFQGKIYVMWSNGHCNEDDVGQRILYSTSEDFDHWTDPVPLVDSQPGEFRDAVTGPGGFYVNGDTMVFYYGSYEYDESWIVDGHRRPGNRGHKNRQFFCKTTQDGIHWSDPIPMNGTIGANHAPARLHSGRLLISGSNFYPYSDNLDGIHDWVMAGIYPKDQDPSQFSDDSEGVERMQQYLGRTVNLCEGSFIQTDDHAIHMMLRSGTDYLWCTESFDDGVTWSEPQQTRFTDNRTKFHFGRLPNGTFYYVGTPDPFPPRTRHVLVLSLSDDGLDYRRHFILQDEQYKCQFVGLDKNGIYGYPDTMVHDGCLYVAYSICKERIQILRVPCDTL